ncbi:MAG: hypothetical protein ACKPBG_13055 [Actinomycetota bacterium]
MKKFSVITRAAIVTSLLAAVAVPAANAASDNEPNLGNSAQSANSNSSRNDYWGGCNGVHGVDNPGQGEGPSQGFGGEGNGLDKDCVSSTVAGEPVPETR